MKTIFKASILSAIFAALVTLAVPAHAADHPAYLHALQDLRHARAHLDKLAPTEHIDDKEQHAIFEIDNAIREIKKASIDDGKPLSDHPPIDTHMSKAGRYHRAIQLLDQAHNDVMKDEDNRFAQGLQARAILHIDAAHSTVEGILNELK